MARPILQPTSGPGWSAGIALGPTEDGAAPLARAIWQFFADKPSDETPADWSALLRRLDEAVAATPEPAKKD